MSTTERVTDEQADANEQTRARYPDEQGFTERDGVRVFYEVYGTGEPTILLCPTWTLVPSRVWKMQIPYLARHHRVVVFDPRGNGKSDRPRTVEAYAESEFAQDALDVLDATGTERAIVVGLSKGAQRALLVAAEHPERVLGLVLIGPFFPASWSPASVAARFMARPRLAGTFLRRPLTTRGFAKFNGLHWRNDYRDFVAWFAAAATNEAHSTKGFDDVVAWGLQTDPETLIRTWMADNAAPLTRRDQLELAGRVQCPVLVINGTDDKLTTIADAELLTKTTNGKLLALEGGDHVPEVRRPVAVSLAIREFVDPSFRRDPTVHRADGRPRALYVSSPIGLGHARRDVAIARELRTLVPDLQVDWLAQHPVTCVLEAEGERIHPASKHLVSESAHFAAESAGHELQCFQAIRRMDEILTANYMVFDDAVSETRYDLWIGDEAWDLDYHLHENPSRKRAPFAWLTDFVGWLPIPENGEREAFVAADYNAEMVEHVRDHPEIRDRAIFVGNPDDIVGDRLGPDLPGIREWTERNFDFAGYITGFDQAELPDRERLRTELGYQPHERVCVVTVGGSGVGADLLARVIAAFPAAAKLVPELRMIVVAGPRIDPATLGERDAHEGLEVHAYVEDLHRHLAACDLAVVQGGLTTTMELTAAQRPFLFFPLRGHFEQRFHVAHRLARYRAGRRMDFDHATPDVIAQAIAQEIGRDVDYRPVEADGARRAAQRIAELLN
ncbi:alpha/beta hydrolase [Baekduia sp.]|jgi:pimeloyl-ACP methyl ester carboxylesterase/predicted glycosyltransferase|uniref:alpha/beta hydrolase n=1 Tax=Baekduia sp. TaxID=2600305 RepID=UPI002DF9327A|nr:alpha/beta fold hydrolase [Baekduia sp.]